MARTAPSSSLFRSALDLMAQYARYHRDRRNIATHFVGIPLIVFGVGVLLARAGISAGEHYFSLAGAVWALSTIWYLTRGNLALGVAVSAVNALLFALGDPLAAGSTVSWLSWGLGSFIVGWVIQFIGHYYEGKKPAFADDLVGLLIGPMFVVGEALFALGWGGGMLAEIERRVGPTHLRDLAHPST
jgi:uncharacterized membrane protein YGL010W